VISGTRLESVACLLHSRAPRRLRESAKRDGRHTMCVKLGKWGYPSWRDTFLPAIGPKPTLWPAVNLAMARRVYQWCGPYSRLDQHTCNVDYPTGCKNNQRSIILHVGLAV